MGCKKIAWLKKKIPNTQIPPELKNSNVGSRNTKPLENSANKSRFIQKKIIVIYIIEARRGLRARGVDRTPLARATKNVKKPLESNV